MKTLSIIVPVYRVELTLNRCVESLLAQQVPGLQLILVDDGSPDSCPQLCDDWARREPCVRVHHKANGGLSDARNAGIALASGDYLTFVDSDDYLAPGTLLPLMQQLEQHPEYDLLEYSVSRQPALPEHVYTDMGAYWLQGHAYEHTYAWNKIYRRELFADVRFPKGRVFEDAYALPRLLRRARVVATTARGLYHYTQNPQGITATAGGPQLQQLLEAHLQSGMPMDDRYYMHLLNIQLDVYDRMPLPPQLPSRRVSPLHSGLNGSQRAKACLLRILGIKGLCRTFRVIHSIKPPRSSASS